VHLSGYVWVLLILALPFVLAASWAMFRRQPRSIRWKVFKSSFEVEWPDADDPDQRSHAADRE